MPRGSNQKFKFTYMMQSMLAKTDDEHGITMPEIIAELDKYGIKAERKSIYDDLQDMSERFGVEIISEKVGRQTYYHVGSRQFELAEVKLLIDAIQSSKFITQNKSRELIAKIKTFVSEHQAKQLQRQVYISNRVKTVNELVYYNVDDIHNAINDNRKIKFRYYKWNINKQLVPRHNGVWFTVSPWALIWDDENYYMVAFDDYSKTIKHYRVDKMMHISVMDEKRQGKEDFKRFDMASYSNETFSMFQGEKTKVKIQFANYMCGVFIDRFGKDICFRPVDENYSVVEINVNISPQFFGWIFSLGREVKVVGPESVVEQMRENAEMFLDNLRNI